MTTPLHRSRRAALLAGTALWLGGAPLLARAAAQPADLFDFWLGDWSLSWRNADGSTGTGRNRVAKILGGKVIEENFEALTNDGPAPLLKGRSLSVLNQGVWRQSWVDNQGGYFTLNAQVDGDRRLFVGAPREQNGRRLQQRMVFHSITPDSLVWDWERSTDGGRHWTRQWRVFYKRGIDSKW